MEQKLSYVCTIGPSMEKLSILEKMYQEGMRTIRFNMSYKHPKMLDLLETAKKLKKNHPDELLFDSAGPEIRIVLKKDLKFEAGDILTIGKDFALTIDSSAMLKKGDLLSIRDGDFTFEVVATRSAIKCRALESGVIKNNNKLYNEKMYDSLPFLSEYDEEIIKLAAENDIDAFAISFVRNKENLKEVRNLFKTYGKENIKLISKIENKQSVENIDGIIKATDEIMIARGDLSTILPRTTIAYYQKLITKKCHKAKTPVMVATGILSAMESDDDAAISEILDLYNMVIDGVKTVVFTAETSVSKDPVAVLRTANEIAHTAKISAEL